MAKSKIPPMQRQKKNPTDTSTDDLCVANILENGMV
jgi:hypothetical protein